MKDLNIYIGKRIKEYREYMKYTQEYMSKELDIAQNHYGRIERGVNACTMEHLIHICNLLHVTPNEITGELVITKEDKIGCNFDKLNIEDKVAVSKYSDYLLSKYNS